MADAPGTMPEHGFWSTSEPDGRPLGWPEVAPAADAAPAEPEPLDRQWWSSEPASPPFEPYDDEPDSLADSLPEAPEGDLAASPYVGLELSEKLQRLLDAVDSLDEGKLAPPLDSTADRLVIEADAVPEPPADLVPAGAEQAPASLIIRYDAGVELRFSGQSALFLERLLRVSADLDALARALPDAATGDSGIAEPPAR